MRIRLLLITTLLSLTVRSLAEPVERSVDTPDFCQTDRAGQFFDRGRKYCAPVAASNSIMWLATHGYPQLIDGEKPAKEAQIELIRTIGSSDYMATETRNGTGPQRFIQGITKYIT